MRNVSSNTTGSARGAERQRNGQRADQKSAAQVVHDVAEQ